MEVIYLLLFLAALVVVLLYCCIIIEDDKNINDDISLHYLEDVENLGKRRDDEE